MAIIARYIITINIQKEVEVKIWKMLGYDLVSCKN